MSEKLLQGFQTAAAGHAHAESLMCTLIPSGDADRQL